MRRAAKVDRNQPEIVEALRKIGCRVQPIHMVGQGCPDVAVYAPKRKAVILMEIKDGTKPPSKRALTADEDAWHALWAEAKAVGAVVVVDSVEAAIEAVEAA